MELKNSANRCIGFSNLYVPFFSLIKSIIFAFYSTFIALIFSIITLVQILTAMYGFKCCIKRRWTYRLTIIVLIISVISNQIFNLFTLLIFMKRKDNVNSFPRTEEMNSFPIWLNILLYIIGLTTAPIQFVCLLTKEIPDFEPI